MRVLNLGCGRRRTGFAEAAAATEIVGLDLSPASEADIIHDLNRIPYPLPGHHFDLIIMQDVIEHLDDILAVLHEVHRLGRPGARVRIRTPHFSSWYAWNDPTHRHVLGVFSLDGFDVDRPNPLQASVRFRFIRREIQFPRLWRLTGQAWLANRFPTRWEQLAAFVIRAENLFFELEVVKP